MISGTPLRLAALCAAAGIAAAGCSRSAQTPKHNGAAQAPRRIELPGNLRPISSSTGDSQAWHEGQSAPAQYQQPQDSQYPTQPRIRELSVTTNSATESRICEPVAAPPPASEQLASATPPRRSRFVPIEVPTASVTPIAATPPQLPAQPNFARAESPSQPAASAVANPEPLPVAPVFPTVESPVQTPPAQAPVNQPPPQQGTATEAKTTTERNVGPPSDPALAVVSRRAMQLADQAAAMAQRGMLYSARTELIQGLQLIAQALDVREGTTRHAAALAVGLTALREARDFAPASALPGEAANVAAIAAGHRTKLTEPTATSLLSPIVAQQQYFALAQAKLTEAAGGLPTGSQLLYRLGRLETGIATHDADPLALHGPQAIAFHQAALATDTNNWLAANELGVLYARYGQLPQARQLLQHSIAIHPHIAGWQNLAEVHRRLGEADLAKLADSERLVLAQQTAKQPTAAGEMIHFVDPKAFAASGNADVPWTADATATAAAPGTGPTRR